MTGLLEHVDQTNDPPVKIGQKSEQKSHRLVDGFGRPVQVDISLAESEASCNNQMGTPIKREKTGNQFSGSGQMRNVK
jgi:hypothetical protein